PPTIRVIGECEPIWILGTFYGYSILQPDVWQPTVEKVRHVLSHWERFHPTLIGCCKATSAIISSHTQYLTRAQGMPPSILTTLSKLMDNFVFNKKGNTIHNSIGINILQLPIEEGGQNLLDINIRNTAIE
ncbi:hypothetical protein BDQ17DRAFT_1262602, partial [Cyathus striatus]